MGKFDHLGRQLEELERSHLLRNLRCVNSAQGPSIQTDSGKEMLLFCSNNYLNLANDPRIIQSALKAGKEYGFGSTASRLISGTMKPHVNLEQKMAGLYRKQAALYFSSGWTANQSVLTTLPQKNDLVLIDKIDHASIIDAVRQGLAAFHTYRRDNLDRLEKYLADPAYQRKYIVTESVFSMDGDCVDFSKLVELKNKYDAILIVDEAHAVGCMGSNGVGLADHQNLIDQVDIFVVPLGKAVASIGAVVVSGKTVIDYLINKARPFIYTTAPPPTCAAAACTAFRIIQQEPSRRERLQQNAKWLRTQLVQMGLDIGNSTTHIIPVLLGDSEKAIAAAAALEDQGIFVLPIRPPTVPNGTARLRISVQSGHTQEHLERLYAALKKLM